MSSPGQKSKQENKLENKLEQSSLGKLYEKDFYLWLRTTARLLEERKLDSIDMDNLIEEIKSMGRREKKEIKSRLTVLIEHLLKLEYWQEEKENNYRNWLITVIEQRRQIDYLLEDSPSLRNEIAENWLNCYEKAHKDLLRKYNLPSEKFPSQCPFSLEQILNNDE